nr:ribonuclease H-like domain-containing protein [Tanacetum cinerariifolium]
MHDLREPRFAALNHILQYVRGTMDFGLQLYASATTSLVSYTDADWAGFPSTRMSTSGYCVFLGDNLLSWSAKRHHTLSCSSVEAEYRGGATLSQRLHGFAIYFATILQQIIDSLHNKFDMTDLGALNDFLGIYADHNSTYLFLSQKKYALRLLKCAQMVNCNPSRTPVDIESKLGPDNVPVQQ